MVEQRAPARASKPTATGTRVSTRSLRDLLNRHVSTRSLRDLLNRHVSTRSLRDLLNRRRF